MNFLKELWLAFIEWIGQIQTTKNNAEADRIIAERKKEAEEEIAAMDEHKMKKKLEELYRD